MWLVNPGRENTGWSFKSLFSSQLQKRPFYLFFIFVHYAISTGKSRIHHHKHEMIWEYFCSVVTELCLIWLVIPVNAFIWLFLVSHLRHKKKWNSPPGNNPFKSMQTHNFYWHVHVCWFTAPLLVQWLILDFKLTNTMLSLFERSKYIWHALVETRCTWCYDINWTHCSHRQTHRELNTVCSHYLKGYFFTG